jgi:hypothetical protein
MSGFWFLFLGYYTALHSLSLFVFNFQPVSQLTRVRKLGEQSLIICSHYEHRRSIVQLKITMTPTLRFYFIPSTYVLCPLHSAACCLFLLSCNIKGVPFILLLNKAALSHRKPSSAGTSCDSYRFQTGSVRYVGQTDHASLVLLRSTLGVFALLQFLNFHVN